MTRRAERLRRLRGRRASGSFIALPHHLLESTEYAELTPPEVKLLLDVFAQFNGRNNGDLTCAWSVMKRRGWRSKDTLTRALRGLLERRFITKTRQGGKHRCSLYAVTWLAIDDCDGKLDVRPTRVASGAWKNNSMTRESYHIDPIIGPIARLANAN